MAVVEQWNPTAEEYHADTERISRSMLEVFRKSRGLYYGRFIDGTIPHPEPTAAMRLGTLLHSAILEPENYAKSTITAPECDRRTKDGKAAWARFLEIANGREVITAEEKVSVHLMASAVRSNAIARQWLELPGQVEHSVAWQDHETGLGCKSRRDKVTADVIIDLKTCRDARPEAFARSSAALGYFRQAAWYLDGEKVAGGTATGFLFIAVCTEPPYEVACYEPDPSDVADARIENRKSLMQLADCIEHDDWLSPHEKQATRLRLPRWALNNEWEIAE